MNRVTEKINNNFYVTSAKINQNENGYSGEAIELLFKQLLANKLTNSNNLIILKQFGIH